MLFSKSIQNYFSPSSIYFILRSVVLGTYSYDNCAHK